MSFHRIAVEKIKEAIAKGEFNNLPGKGTSLDLDAYFTTTTNGSILRPAWKSALDITCILLSQRERSSP
jgi:DnaJ-like protein